MAMENEKSYIPKGVADQELQNAMKAREVSAKKFQNLGQLGVTAKDHFNVDSSGPAVELSQNPGKTLGEILTDEELEQKIQKLQIFMETSKKRLKDNPKNDWAKEDVKYAKREFSVTLSYLKSLGRLPEKYKDMATEQSRRTAK